MTLYAELMCIKCAKVDGFTLPNLRTPHNYWCDRCDTYTQHKYTGHTFHMDGHGNRSGQLTVN